VPCHSADKLPPTSGRSCQSGDQRSNRGLESQGSPPRDHQAPAGQTAAAARTPGTALDGHAGKCRAAQLLPQSRATTAVDPPAHRAARGGQGSAESRPGPRSWRSAASARRSADSAGRRGRRRGASAEPTSSSGAWVRPRPPRGDPSPGPSPCGDRRRRPAASARGKPLHSTERSKGVTVHYRWHPLYGQIARINRSVPCGNGELLFCELPDGTRGTLPSWMTDAAACAALTVGTPVVAITALQELQVLLDVLARGSDLVDVSMPSKEGCDAPKESTETNPPDTAVPARRTRTPRGAGRPTTTGADPSVGRATPARRGRRQRGTGGSA
jgi:hypothetical protein